MSREPTVVQVVILRDGLLIGTEVFLPGSYTIGSSPLADLRLDDRAIEPLHAFLYFKNLKAVIRASQSTGGLYVNGHRVTVCQVRSIDEVACGPYLLKARVITRNSPLPVPPDVEALLSDGAGLRRDPSPGSATHFPPLELPALEAQGTAFSARRLSVAPVHPRPVRPARPQDREDELETRIARIPLLWRWRSRHARPRLCVETRWRGTRLNVQSFVGNRRSVTAADALKAPVPVWGLPFLPRNFVLAKPAPLGFQVFIPPGVSVDEGSRGSKFSRVSVLESDGNLYLFLKTGDAIRMKAGPVSVLAYVAPRLEKTSAKPRPRRPSLAVASFLGCLAVFGAFLSLKPTRGSPPELSASSVRRLVRILAATSHLKGSTQPVAAGQQAISAQAVASRQGRRRPSEPEVASTPTASSPSARPSTHLDRGPLVPSVVRASGRAIAVKGDIRRSAIAKVVHAHLQELHQCYGQISPQPTDLAGEVQVAWAISSSGKVLKARVRTSSLANREVESCLLEHLKTWRFPKPRGGLATVVYPFRFWFPASQLNASAS